MCSAQAPSRSEEESLSAGRQACLSAKKPNYHLLDGNLGFFGKIVGFEGYFKKANSFAFLKAQALEEEMRHVP